MAHATTHGFFKMKMPNSWFYTVQLVREINKHTGKIIFHKRRFQNRAKICEKKNLWYKHICLKSNLIWMIRMELHYQLVRIFSFRNIWGQNMLSGLGAVGILESSPFICQIQPARLKQFPSLSSQPSQKEKLWFWSKKWPFSHNSFFYGDIIHKALILFQSRSTPNSKYQETNMEQNYFLHFQFY